MELRHLRNFVALAEELNFTRAAVRLHMAQPALSVQIRRLEKEVGAELLLRAGRNTKLTEAGVVFLQHARQMLAQVPVSIASAQQAAKGEIGQLRIGCSAAAEFRVFPAIVPAFKKQWPNIHLSFRQMGSIAQVDALRRGDLDLAFTWLPIAGSEFDIEELNTEPFIAMIHAGHPLS